MKQSEQKLTLDLENHFTALVLWLSNKMTAGASKAYRRKFGMGVNKSAVSRGCAVLMEHGLIVSRPRGLRKIEYGITPKGKVAFQQFLRVSVARQEALLTGFSNTERKLLISFMHRLLDNLPLAEKASED